MSEAGTYVDKWLAREPGMEIARGFCPVSQRQLFELWGALLNELDETVFELSDANVTQTKLAWWADELARTAAQSARHPLARVLSTHAAVRAVAPAEWHALAHAGSLAASHDRPSADVDAWLATTAPYARVTARIEAALFGGAPAPDAIAVHHAMRRLDRALLRDASALQWPLNLRARHQVGADELASSPPSSAAQALIADLGKELAERAQAAAGGALYRRCRTALDWRRARRLAAGKLAPERAASFGALWQLWRAARRAA